jgi:protein-tyrosine kinase
LADVILRTNIPHLSILPAGQAVDNPTEILASQRMKDLISEIIHRYPDRFILFDSPPVLATSEPGVLAAYVGQVIMVVLANETTKQAITESLGLIDACPNINFILNKVTLSAGSDRFGYDGYYEG